ncbi:MAG: hypothetical protein IT434_04445 [Phycisphaerales bacterium]|nr:hypothetical protein [Phycisphaerales bacterium]
MSKIDAIVVLRPSCLEVARLSGGIVRQSARVSLGETAMEAAWNQSLRPLDKPLAVALQQAGVRAGASLRFIYRSPDSVTEPINLKAAGADLTEPARLALAESTPFPWAEAVSGVRRLKVHAKEGAWYLGVAERRCNTDLLDALASRNGFRIADALTDRAMLIDTVTRRFAASADRHSRCLVELGAASSAILTSHQGKVTSLRCVDLGYDAFIEAVMRSQSSRRDEELAFDAAVAVIAKIGLLPRGDLSAISNGAIDDSMKPLMRAAVQRLVVEVRQTIRFGLPEGDAVTCRIEVGGPGSAIPNLATTLSSHTDLEVVCEPGGPELIGAPMAAAAAGLPGAEWIVPAGESLRRERRLLHASLIAGGILAVGLLAYEGFSVSRELTTERAVLAERQAKVDALHAEVDARREAGVVSKNLARLERGVDEVGGEHTPWRAFFREIAGLCELHPVRMTDVSTSTVPGGTSWSLKGIVFLDQNSQVDPLSQFIESLQRSPLVAGVEVGATRRIEVEGRAAKQFSVSAQVRALHLGQDHAALGLVGEDSK